MNNKFYQLLHNAIQQSGQTTRVLQNTISTITPKLDEQEEEITELQAQVVEIIYEKDLEEE